MTGKTHRVGGMLCVLGGYTLLESKGLLIKDVSPLLQLTVMYPFAIYGSIISDLDHNWNSAPSKDIISFIINKVLHLTTKVRQGFEKTGVKTNKVVKTLLSTFDAKHRSWQTHSDLFLFVLLAIAFHIFNSSVPNANQIILTLISSGFILGVISHLILDMLTPEGIWCLITTIASKVTRVKALPQKIHLVPKTKFFATGGPWEVLVRYIMWCICFLLLLRILYYMSPYRISFSM